MNSHLVQNRNAQENIIYKDEQLREAQAWISRVQEMDALQSSTNHTLQNELRERTEQYNQLWIACQRQVTLLDESISLILVCGTFIRVEMLTFIYLSTFV